MTNLLKSALTRVRIEVERYIDHYKRILTGLPTLSTSQITPNLFVGGQYKVKAFTDLKAFGITAIVNMRMHTVHSGKNIPGIAYLHLPTPNRHAPSIEQLTRGVRFIRKEINKGGKVYIHCKAGEGRGPTMAAAYLISDGLTVSDAVETIRKVRRFIRPTKLQINQLKLFESLKF